MATRGRGLQASPVDLVGKKRKTKARTGTVSTGMTESTVLVTRREEGYSKIKLKQRSRRVAGNHPSEVSSKKLSGCSERTCGQMNG